MSATRPSRGAHAPARAVPRDMTVIHARRREARLRQRLVRVDLGLGVLLAIVLLVATPGLAIAAILAGVLLALCAGSAVVQRRRRRDAQRGSRTKTAMSRDVRSS